MAIQRQLNVISQMRLDVSHVRLLESAVAGDFDVLARGMVGGEATVLRGFTVVGAVNSQANALLLSVSDGIVVNRYSTESGSILWVPVTRPAELLDGATNGAVTGAFVNSAVNYVGIDFVRETDDTTTDLVKFKDPVTGSESERLVPLGLTLDYKIVISTIPFSVQRNITPVAKITVNSTGQATVITDARNLLFRLGSGGDVPNTASSYAWPTGRTESSFTGADKSFTSQKEWMDALMTRVWELGGGTNWYSPTADRNVQMVNTGLPFTNGDYWTFDSGTGATTWQGIRMLFDGSATATYNDVSAGSGIVADGSCVYVDLNRTSNATLTASVTSLATVGVGAVPGSRWILAWRSGTSLFQRNWRYPVGTTFQPATTTSLGVVQLNQTPASPTNPKVVSIMTGGGVVVAATSGNTAGGDFTGFGSGAGLIATAPGSGSGTYSVSVAGVGVYGESSGLQAGGFFTNTNGTPATAAAVGVHGDSYSNTGGVFIGSIAGGAGNGVEATASDTGHGVVATAAGAGNGIVATSTGGGSGGAFSASTTGNGHGATGIGFGSGSGFVGSGGATNGTGVRGAGGGSSGLGGFFTSSAGGGYGVWGDVNASATNGNGGRFRGRGTGYGVRGDVEGAGATGDGGQFVGGASGGSGITATGQGTGSGAIITGGPTSGATAVQVIAQGTGKGITIYAPSNVGLEVTSAGSGVAITNTANYVYSATRTGVLIVPLTAWQKVSTASTGFSFNTGGLRWELGAVNLDSLHGSINLPRSATITDIEVLVVNGSTTSYNPGASSLVLTRNVYDGTTSVATNLVLSTAPTPAVSASSAAWISYSMDTLAAVKSGSTGANASSWVEGILAPALSPATGSQYVAFKAIKVTYTYSTVDFMV